MKKYTNLKEFYPYYLTEHQNDTSRMLHFVGTGTFLFILVYAIVQARYGLLWLCPLVGYGFAWVGHFFFEKNKPATFKYPGMSLASDFIMFWHIITGQLPQKMKEAKEKIID
jgi:hypothetical protein